MPRLLAAVALAVAVSVVALSPLAGQPPKGKKYALLVGVSYYKNVYYSPLKGTENDVVELAKVLRQPSSGFEVTLLTSTPGHEDPARAPTAANIRKEMAKLLEGKGREDTVLLAFAGHGADVEVADPDGKQPPRTYTYFMPTDADDLEKISHSTGHSDHLIEMGDVLRRMTAPKCGAGTKLLLVDACRENVKAASSVRARSSGYTPVKEVPVGVSALFSCGPGQVALETGFDVGEEERRVHGVFFWHVIQGLKGKAPKVRGAISWPSLTSYVQAEVPAFVKDVVKRKQPQTPHPISNSPELAVLVRESEGKEEVVSSIGMKLAPIPKGKFTMGSPADEKHRMDDEQQHEVELTRDFHLGEKEVTQAQFKAVMGYNPSYFSKDGESAPKGVYKIGKPAAGKDRVSGSTADYPVEQVSWDEAMEFCRKLTAKDRVAGKIGRDHVYRLPTEAEWEYACRGGATSYQVFHFGNSLSRKQVNYIGGPPYSGDKEGVYWQRTREAGSYEKNAFGLFDMHGNVSEWCHDWYDKDYYKTSPPRDPRGRSSPGSRRVLHGGSWFSGAENCRSASRYTNAPEDRDRFSGFRVALVPVTGE